MHAARAAARLHMSVADSFSGAERPLTYGRFIKIIFRVVYGYSADKKISFLEVDFNKFNCAYWGV